MLVEIAVRCNVRPICSAMLMKRLLITDSNTESSSVLRMGQQTTIITISHHDELQSTCQACD